MTAQNHNLVEGSVMEAPPGCPNLGSDSPMGAGVPGIWATSGVRGKGVYFNFEKGT